jgi:hypothetical protein
VSSLLATPTRWLGRRPKHSEGDAERWTDPKRSYELSDQMAHLLPTPRTTDSHGPGKHGDGGLDLRTAASLLPTPVARDWKGRGMKGQLPTELLPTPTANDDNKTPEAHMRMKKRLPGGERNTITSLQVLAKNDLKQPGDATPAPSSDGKRSPARRLSPFFVEWMLGLPHGFSDPDCQLSATEFRSRSRSFWAE